MLNISDPYNTKTAPSNGTEKTIEIKQGIDIIDNSTMAKEENGNVAVATEVTAIDAASSTEAKHKEAKKAKDAEELEKERIEAHKQKYKDWPLYNVDAVLENDVMCGRGAGTNHHPGNKRFRQLAESRKVDYNVKFDKIRKPLIAWEIIREIRGQSPPGRFLLKDKKTGKWNDVGDDKAHHKTVQALREGGPEIRKQYEQQMNGDSKTARSIKGTVKAIKEKTDREVGKCKQSILQRGNTFTRFCREVLLPDETSDGSAKKSETSFGSAKKSIKEKTENVKKTTLERGNAFKLSIKEKSERAKKATLERGSTFVRFCKDFVSNDEDAKMEETIIFPSDNDTEGPKPMTVDTKIGPTIANLPPMGESTWNISSSTRSEPAGGNHSTLISSTKSEPPTPYGAQQGDLYTPSPRMYTSDSTLWAGSSMSSLIGNPSNPPFDAALAAKSWMSSGRGQSIEGFDLSEFEPTPIAEESLPGLAAPPPPGPPPAFKFSGLSPRPRAVKRSSSKASASSASTHDDNSDNDPTSPSMVKRATLNRDQSAVANKLKKKYIPEVFNQRMQSLTLESDSEHSGSGKASQFSSRDEEELHKFSLYDKPAPITSDQRRSTYEDFEHDLLAKYE